jgi:hypothetical protein
MIKTALERNPEIFRVFQAAALSLLKVYFTKR